MTSSSSTAVKLIQYYVHSDIVNWLKMRLDHNYSDILTIYDEVYHCDFGKDVKCAHIYDEPSKVYFALLELRGITEMAQYKMPWINDTTYYTRSEDKMNSIIKNLGTVTLKYSIEVHRFTLEWFGQNDLFVTHFATDCNNDDDFKALIDNEFRTRIENYDKELFITNVMSLHKTFDPPCAMQTNIFTAFNGKLLDYLSIDDVFSLEIALKDHRIPNIDLTLDYEIQHNLRKRLPFLYGDEMVPEFHPGQFTHLSTLCHFICKYHDRLTHISSPVSLADYEVILLSQLYNIQINQTTHSCAYFLNSEGSTQLSFSYSLLDRQDNFKPRPIFWQNNKSWDDFLAVLDENANIELYVRSEKDCSPKLLMSLFIKLYFSLQHHNRYKTHIILKSVELRTIPPQCLQGIFLLCASVQLERVAFDLLTLHEILKLFLPFSYVTLKNCHITSRNFTTSGNTNPTMLSRLRFVEFDFDVDTFLTIIQWLPQEACIDLIACRFLPSNYETSVKTVTLSVVKFFKMKLETQVLLEVLEIFSANTEFSATDCIIISSNDDSSRSLSNLKLSNLKFYTSNVDVAAIFNILEKCPTNMELVFYKSFIRSSLPLTTVNVNYFQIRSVVFIGTSLETIALSMVMQRLTAHCRVFLADCKIIPYDGLMGEIETKVSTILFTNVDFDTSRIVTILSQFSSFADINFDNCAFNSTKSVLPCVSYFKPLTLKFKTCRFESEFLLEFLKYIHPHTMILLDDCHVSDIARLENSSITSFACLQFTGMDFKLGDLIKIFTKINSVSKFMNCTIEREDDLFLMNTIDVSSNIFSNMTFSTNTLFQLLERYSKTTTVFFDSCQFIDGYRSSNDLFRRYYHLKIVLVEFTDTNFITKDFISILAKFPVNAQIFIRNCQFISDDRVSSAHPLDLVVEFSQSVFESPALLQIIQIFSKKSKVWFTNCDIEQPMNWVPKKISVQIKYLPFHDSTKFSYALINVLQCIQSTDYTLVFYNCELSGQNVIDICTKTSLNGNRLEILGSHQINEAFYFNLFLEYYRVKRINFDNLRMGDELGIPVHVIPAIKNINRDFEWDNFRLVCVPVNDVTIKLEILKNDKVVDLFNMLDGFDDETDECEVDYY